MDLSKYFKKIILKKPFRMHPIYKQIIDSEGVVDLPSLLVIMQRNGEELTEETIVQKIKSNPVFEFEENKNIKYESNSKSTTENRSKDSQAE